jgi:hypothetical protein
MTWPRWSWIGGRARGRASEFGAMRSPAAGGLQQLLRGQPGIRRNFLIEEPDALMF